MNLDARQPTKTQPAFGCHSDFDHTRKSPSEPCNFANRDEEKACEGCKHRYTNDDKGSE